MLLGLLSLATWAGDATKLNRQLMETIVRVRTGETAQIRQDAAKHLVELTRGVDPNNVDDKVLDDIVSLLDSSEDGVRVGIVTALRNLGPRADVAVRNQLVEAISRVRAGETAMIRRAAARHVFELTRGVNPNKLDDKVLADIVSLLDSSEDAVRFEVAAALGNLGPRAKIAVPKLLKVLEEVDCLPLTVTSALTIRVALPRIGVTPPPQRCAGT
jgi:HEAT repeat protein